MNKITAIVSAYYAEEYLEGRLENLLNQTLRPEIVVVCQSGSPEEEIVGRFMTDAGTQDADGIYVIRTEGIPSVYSAWNVAIRHSKSDYLTNANSDDRLAPDALEKAVGILDQRRKVGVVYFDVDVVDNLDGGFETAERIGKFEWAEGDWKRLLEIAFVGPCPVWRRSIHQDFGLFDETLQVAGDYEFWIRIMKEGVRFFHLREPLAIYLRRRDSREHREPYLTIWETAHVRGRYRPPERTAK